MFGNEKDFEEIVNRLNIDTRPDSSHRDKLREEMLSVYNDAKRQSQKHTTLSGVFRRTIMRNPITKIAAAAVIIVGVILGTYYIGGPFTATVTFADVIKPILNAQTAEFDITVGEDDQGPVIHDMVKGSRIRRTMSNMEDNVSIIDLESGRILSITVSKKVAVYVDLKGLPSIPNYLEVLKNIINMLQDSPDFEVEELGQQDIQGQSVIGFRAKHPKAEITIWADSETALPVWIEQIEPQLKVICKNVKFDSPMDDSLFSMDVPDGYELQQVELDLMGSTEQDFIEGLLIRAEVFGEGWFPESVAVEDYIKDAPAIEKKMEELGLSDEEETDLGMKLSRHLLFIRFFKGQGQWHYAGQGVKLGDGDTPIFWYQPQHSETYRVIYGDLSVQDVAPENLPE
jgi:outer membrane lipoprotein-sorting protein